MDSHSYVAREGEGFVAYLGDQRLGWHEFQSEAESNFVNQLQTRHTLREQACVRTSEQSVAFSHARPSGEPWHTVFPAGWTGTIVENLASAPGFDAALRGWLASPQHRDNLHEPVSDFGYCVRDGYHVALGWRK